MLKMSSHPDRHSFRRPAYNDFVQASSHVITVFVGARSETVVGKAPMGHTADGV